MSHRPTAQVMTAGLLLMVGGLRPATASTAPEKGTPVPAHARVSIELDQKEYFLGENVLLHFCIENTGKEPFEIDLGGDYRGASRHLRFDVEVIDEAGKLCDDPDPSGFCLGGLGGSVTVEPGKTHYESIPLLRYRRIENPGVYKIQASHDLGWTETPDRKRPVAETTVTFKRPTEGEARKLVDAMFSPARRYSSPGGKSSPYPDFSVLRDPVYLPILLERAKEKPEQALEGTGSIAAPEATEALIRLARDEDGEFALSAAQTLDSRLPDPQLNGELPGRNPFLNDRLEARRWLVKQSWRPRLADDVAELARKFLARKDQEGVEVGGFMLQCVGRSEDLPHLTRALDQEIAAAAKLPPEEGVYPRPRGACRELLRAAQAIGARGIKEPLETDTAGQAVVFLCAIGASDKFRPEGWETRYARLMQHETAYVREVALDNLPAPAPDSMFKLLPGLITDKDVDVQIAACHVAEKTKRRELKEPVLKALAAAREEWLFNAASNAAHALDADWEQIEILVSRLDEEGMTKLCLSYLVSAVVEDAGSRSGPSDKWTAEDSKACKARWAKFLQEHGKELKTGRRFKRDDPAITPDLLPTMKLGL
jgi:hypothetical protein